MTTDDLDRACRIVAEGFYGERGRWAYEQFDRINRDYFGGALPTPLITFEITPHGKCLGQTSSTDRPHIRLHPSVFGGTEVATPWGTPAEWLGELFAADVLIHECMHVSVRFRLGGAKGPTSHNNPQWIGEVNRLAPLLGFSGIKAGRQVAKRFPVEGEVTKRGKPQTTVKKATDGNIPFKVVATFPHSLRVHLGEANDYYVQYPLAKSSRQRLGMIDGQE
jgi:hypothetical protein